KQLTSGCDSDTIKHAICVACLKSRAVAPPIFVWRSRLAWSRAHDWKSCRRQKRLEGSNPSFSAMTGHRGGCRGHRRRCPVFLCTSSQGQRRSPMKKRFLLGVAACLFASLAGCREEPDNLTASMCLEPAQLTQEEQNIADLLGASAEHPI